MCNIVENNNENIVAVELEIEFYDEKDNLVGCDYDSVDAISKNSKFTLEIWNTSKSYNYFKIYNDVEETDD